MNYLDKKTVIVTGASLGIGAATARALADASGRVIGQAIQIPPQDKQFLNRE